jgi:hypothetical protein
MKQALSFACVLLVSFGAAPQEPAEKKGDLGAVREEHRLLARLAGVFDVKQREFTEKGEVDEERTGTLERTMTLDGRFLEEKASLMSKNAESKVLVWLGFDARKGKFVAVTVNSHSTLPLLSEGIWNRERREIQFIDEEFDPQTKKLIGRTREVYRFVSDDEQTFEEFVQIGNAKEHRTLEIQYRRKK